VTATCPAWLLVLMLAVDIGGILALAWVLLAQFRAGPPKPKVIKDTAHPDTKREMVQDAVRYWMGQGPEA
jgi:hypothetical protein